MTTATLTQPTLVLNRNWQPVGVMSVARALTKVFSGKARIVDPDDYRLYTWEDWSVLQPSSDEPFIQTYHDRLRVPEVVTLASYDRVPTHVVTFSRRNVFKRDKFTCQYCGRHPNHDDLTIDHVVPRSHGGTSSWTNCVLACTDCNSGKADRTPDQAGMRLLRQPTRPIWRPMYAARGVTIDSWQKFVSETFWNVELAD
jgi:hypothetical protein